MKNLLGLGALGVLFLVITLPRLVAPVHAVAEAPPAREPELKAQVDELRTEIKKLQGVEPDQAAVMSHLAYHWSNLWFALDQENWPLASFYLSETRSNLKWAIRVKPLRKDPMGKETVNVKEIGEAMDNGPFADLNKALTARDKQKCIKLYNDALTGCYACHKASYKPYLRPRVPTAPEVRVINFDPRADKPE